MRRVTLKRFFNIILLFVLIYLGLFAVFGRRVDSAVEKNLNNSLKSTNQNLLKKQAADPKALTALQKNKN